VAAALRVSPSASLTPMAARSASAARSCSPKLCHAMPRLPSACLHETARMYGEMRGDVGRCGEMWGDVPSSATARAHGHGDMGRLGEIWGCSGEGDMPSSATERAPRAAAAPQRERASPRTPPPRRRRRPGSSTRCLRATRAEYASIGAGLGHCGQRNVYSEHSVKSQDEASKYSAYTAECGRMCGGVRVLSSAGWDARMRIPRLGRDAGRYGEIWGDTPLLAHVAPLMQCTHSGGGSGARASRRPRGQQGVRQRVRRQGAASVPQPAAPPPRRRPPN